MDDRRPTALHVSSIGRYSGLHWLSLFDNGTMTGAGAWPAANRALYVPVYMPGPFVVARFWCANGAGLTDDRDMGLYDQSFTRLVSTGAVAAGSASVVQYAGVTDAKFGPGRYYLGMSVAGTTATFIRIAPALLATLQQGGMYDEASAHPLPSAATPTTPDTAYIPLFGFTQSDSV